MGVRCLPEFRGFHGNYLNGCSLLARVRVVCTVTTYMSGIACTGREVSMVAMQMSVPSLPGSKGTSRLVLNYFPLY